MQQALGKALNKRNKPRIASYVFGVRMRLSLAEQLDEFAKLRGRNRNALINEAIARLIAEESKLKEPAA